MELTLAEPKYFAAVAEAEQAAFAQPLSLRDLEELSRDTLFRILLWHNGDDVVGHCVLYRVLDEAQITSFVIREDRRGQGQGTMFLRALTEYLRSDGAKIAFLEVRQSNRAAQRMYEKCGFTVIGIRKDFYERPPEDAIAMGVEL